MDTTPPTLAIISNGVTPYGLHSYRRMAREIPEIRLVVYYTHDYSMGEWPTEAPREFPVTRFGIGERATGKITLPAMLHEWAKAGRVIQQLQTDSAKAVIMLGYNDLGRLRILRWCKRNGIPLFILADSNIRGDRSSGLKAQIKQAVLPRILAQCAGVMPCGSLGSAYFQKYGVIPDKIFLVPNEPDYTLIEQVSAEQLAQVKEQFGLAANHRRIIFSGRLVSLKRVDLLLQAFSQISELRQDWDMVIVGDGPQAAQLHNLTPENLRSRIIWTGFIGSQATLAALYRACDLLVLPSHYEAWALVVNEAVAAGLAVICSHAVGAAPELIQESGNGWTFPTDDVEMLSARLQEATSPDRIDSLKSASAAVLQAWRDKADPIAGVRSALRYCGILSVPPQ
ncbi:MAG: glycosyltransferase family 4 protein [Candidatus Methylumidiphilus sp.]